MSQDTVIPKYYIELNSTYRNRNMWPNQARFDVPIMNSGQKDFVEDAMDPITLQDSEFFWKGRDPTLATYVISGGTPSAPIVDITNYNGDAFKGQFLAYDDVDPEMSLITFYSRFSKTAFLETPFSSSWAVGQLVRLIDFSDGLNIGFLMRKTTFEDQFVDRYLVDFTCLKYRKITNFNEKFHMITLESTLDDGQGIDWNIDDEYIITKEIPHFIGFFRNDPGVGNGNVGINTITIDDLDNDNYIGKWIKLIQWTGGSIIDTTTRYIIDYDDDTKTLTVDKPITETYNNTDNVNYIITDFKKDIASYLSSAINNSITSRLYKISLNNLILPNAVIGNSLGGTTSNYPYVYVTFVNKTIETKSLINSNNPASYRASFRCAIDDVENPEYATFIKLRSEMVSTFYYNPKDEISFEVILPSGQTFTTLEADNQPPLEPNPLLQISCTISLEEIDEKIENLDVYQDYY